MNQFGETPSIYVWPKGHEQGEAFPAGFYAKLHDALNAAGFEWESV